MIHWELRVQHGTSRHPFEDSAIEEEDNEDLQ